MNPPDDYRRGYQRYCLACWLGVGPKDGHDLFGDTAQMPTPKNTDVGRVLGTDIRYEQRKTRQVGGERSADGINRHPSVYLWLSCEGWMRFGPFEWLRFDDERQAILGPDGEVVAKKEAGQWRIPGEKWQGWGFSNPTITTTAVHPHPKSGSHPR